MSLISQSCRVNTHAVLDQERNGRSDVRAILGAVSCLAAIWLAACWMDEPRGDAELYFARHNAAIYSDREPETVPQLLDFDVKMTILQEHRSFVNVLTEDGLEGWVSREHLIDSETRDWNLKLTKKWEDFRDQGRGRAWDTLNVHSEPYRWAPTLYQLAKDQSFEVLDRTLVQRLPSWVDANEELAATAALPYSDYWFLVRVSEIERCGWLLENMVYADVPTEVAMVAGGQPIVAHSQLGSDRDVADGRSARAWLLAQSSEDGQVFDFDVLRVLRWNSSQGRFAVVRRVSGLRGYLPIETLDEVVAHGRGGIGFRVFVERDGKLREKTYLYHDGLVLPADDLPSTRGILGSIGESYKFRPFLTSASAADSGSP
ncbi:MAG: hypothetical protein OXN89_20915 [Bryobacterales bacterium]|nr:hypothetical protein [Bryobacterales bacterium]